MNEDGWVIDGKLPSDVQLAERLHLDRGTVFRVRTRRLSPGPVFIRGALKAYPKKRFEDLFTVAP